MFLDPSGTSASPSLRHFQEDPRAMRLASEFRKLAASARNVLHSRHHLTPLGNDPVVEHLVSSAGFGEFDVFVHRTGARERIVTALCVPTRVWRDSDCRHTLLDIKHRAAGMGTSCILVPQRFLRAPVRSSVARVLAAARNTPYARSHKKQVLDHLSTVRISSLAEAASAIVAHDDPVGVVLAMACHGLIDVDRTKPLASGTYVAAAMRISRDDLNGEQK